LRAASACRLTTKFRCLENKFAGVRNLHPGYRSILIVFDPLLTEPDKLEEQVGKMDLEQMVAPDPRLVTIPVHYDGPEHTDGPCWHAGGNRECRLFFGLR
jgi:allophanate hydrolase subunit 1